MRHAHQTLPWFLALTLCSLSACSDSFRVPACEFSMDSPFCSNTADLGTGQQMGGSMPDGSSGAPDMTPRPPMKGPVTFDLAFLQPLTVAKNAPYYSWVGIHPPNITVFARQDMGSADASLEYFKLTQETATGTWTRNPITIMNCPTKIKGASLSSDTILTSKSKFFIIRPPYAYSLNSDETLSKPINSADNALLQVVPLDASHLGFRPFSGMNSNFITYQKTISAANATEISYYDSTEAKKTITFTNSSFDAKKTYYYAIGPLDTQPENLAGDSVLIFKDALLAGAYKLDSSLSPIIDQELTDEINNKVLSTSNTGGHPVRSAFIADFNQDGYMDIIYARRNNVFITSYNPEAGTGARFTNWQMSLPTISSIDHTQSISVADLNGDGFPDLAIEVVMPGYTTENVYFYINNKK